MLRRTDLGDTNDRSLLLLEFDQIHMLTLTNALHYEKKRFKLSTWHFPDNSIHNQIDFILLPRRSKSSIIKVKTRARMSIVTTALSWQTLACSWSSASLILECAWTSIRYETHKLSSSFRSKFEINSLSWLTVTWRPSQVTWKKCFSPLTRRFQDGKRQASSPGSWMKFSTFVTIGRHWRIGSRANPNQLLSITRSEMDEDIQGNRSWEIPWDRGGYALGQQLACSKPSQMRVSSKIHLSSKTALAISLRKIRLY